jgi:hyperosmotically inducible protein
MKQLNYFSALLTILTLLFFTGCAATSTQESTGEYIDDSVITTKAKAAIFNDPDLKSAEINVETFRGVVQLSGFVSSRTGIDRAVAVVRSINGVQSVRNDMQIK